MKPLGMDLLTVWDSCTYTATLYYCSSIENDNLRLAELVFWKINLQKRESTVLNKPREFVEIKHARSLRRKADALKGYKLKSRSTFLQGNPFSNNLSIQRADPGLAPMICEVEYPVLFCRILTIGRKRQTQGDEVFAEMYTSCFVQCTGIGLRPWGSVFGLCLEDFKNSNSK